LRIEELEKQNKELKDELEHEKSDKTTLNIEGDITDVK